METVAENSRGGSKDDPVQLGQSIRRRRKALGMTLAQVAVQSELTTGFISQVESGISSPSLSSLLAIASTLQSSVEELLSVANDFSPYISQGMRKTYALGLRGRRYEKLGPGFPGALCYPSIIHRPAGHVSERMRHEGEVFCYLLAGRLEYHLGDQVHMMSAGDTIHHDTSIPHFSIVVSEEDSEELWVSTLPIKAGSTPL